MMVAPITHQRKDAVIGSYTDITDYKNMQKQVVEFKELDRMKTNLLSLVSHELRTPLSTIKGYTSLMLNYQSRLKENESREYLETMDKATDRLTGLIQHLLDMSRLDAGLFVLNKAPASISGLLRETVDEAKVRIPTHKLTLVMDKRLPKMNIDAARLREVVDNLLDNARKYSQPGTEIEVRARRLKGEVVVSVTDHGVGIPASELPGIFDKMYR